METVNFYQTWVTSYKESMASEWDRCGKLYSDDLQAAKSMQSAKPKPTDPKYHIHGFPVKQKKSIFIQFVLKIFNLLYFCIAIKNCSKRS